MHCKLCKYNYLLIINWRKHPFFQEAFQRDSFLSLWSSVFFLNSTSLKKHFWVKDFQLKKNNNKPAVKKLKMEWKYAKKKTHTHNTKQLQLQSLTIDQQDLIIWSASVIYGCKRCFSDFFPFVFLKNDINTIAHPT